MKKLIDADILIDDLMNALDKIDADDDESRKPYIHLLQIISQHLIQDVIPGNVMSNIRYDILLCKDKCYMYRKNMYRNYDNGTIDRIIEIFDKNIYNYDISEEKVDDSKS